MRADDPSRHSPAPPADFALGNTHARNGSSTHRSGWQGAVPIARDASAAPFGSQHVARPVPDGTIPRAPLTEQLRHWVADHDQHNARPAADSAFASTYAQSGSSSHRSGWQEAVPITRDPVTPPFGSQHVARSVPEGGIPRTSLAQRLRQRVAEHEKG
jgi:hypothetical protein